MYDLKTYELHLRQRNASADTIEARLDFAHRMAAAWPDPRLVTPEDVAQLVWSATYAPWTVATYFGHVRSVFTWMVSTGRLPADPTAGMTRPRTPKGCPRPLSPADASRARIAAAPDHRAMLLLGMFAGLRAHEVAKIRGDEITEEHVFVVGKGGSEHLIPTHPLIWAEAQTRGQGYWFPGRSATRPHVARGAVTNRTTRLFASLGIEGSFHRCRHFYGTSLLRSGVNLRVVQELMRHASLATTAAYLGVDEDEKRAAVLGLVA